MASGGERVRVGFISDTHLGFGARTERANEAADNFRQGLELLVREDVDVILHPGDFFDEDVPSQETWSRTFEAFMPLAGTVCAVRITRRVGDAWVPFSVRSTPLVAIHGTHEYRGKGYANCVAVLEKAGKLVYVHGGVVGVEKNGERVYVHGLGGVPEKKAREVLHAWNPAPVAGALNVLVMHQSFSELLPFGDDMTASLSFSDLPPGFDLYVNGHFHAPIRKQLDDKEFFVPGSTLITQMKKNEAQKPKGVWVWDTEPNRFDFFPIPLQRDLFYLDVRCDGEEPRALLEKVRRAVSQLGLASAGLKPLVRVRVRGTLAKGFLPRDADFSALERDFSDVCILNVGSKLDAVDSVGSQLQAWREARADALSIQAMARGLLEKNLVDSGASLPLPLEELLDFLESERSDELLAVLDPPVV